MNDIMREHCQHFIPRRFMLICSLRSQGGWKVSGNTLAWGSRLTLIYADILSAFICAGSQHC